MPFYALFSPYVALWYVKVVYILPSLLDLHANGMGTRGTMYSRRVMRIVL